MSSVAISGNASGAGVLTIAAPNTASNFTLTLPAATGTILTGTTPTVTTTMGVGNATPASSGSGITFPATQSASTDANTLDDYEEGTWTPSIGGTATYTVQSGTYTKIGRLVYVSFALQITAMGTGSTSTVSGLPFASTAGPRNSIPLCYWTGTANTLVYLTGYNISGGTTIGFGVTSSVATNIGDAYTPFVNSTYIIGSGCYHAS